MTRFSRLKTPRANLSALLLLTAFMLAFHLTASLGHAETALATGAPATVEEQSDGPRLLPCENG